MARLFLLLILVPLVVRALSRLADGIRAGLKGPAGSSGVPRRGVSMVRDPVCGTFVVPDRAVMLTDGSERFYFCSSECRGKYQDKAG